MGRRNGWLGRRLGGVKLLCAVGLLAAASGWAQSETPDAAAQNRALGRAVNVLGYDPIWRDSSQARFRAEHFRLIREGGFRTVRVNLHPFRHMGAGPEFRLAETWLATLDWAVTNALDHGLMVILDLHEFNALGADPEANKGKFLAFWRQLAPRFQAAPPEVLFEILNEPCLKLTPPLWNEYLREALAIIRSSNPTRTVVVGPAFWNSFEHLRELELPAEDKRLILTVHYYQPMDFTHQGAPWAGRQDKLGVTWNATPAALAALTNDLQHVQDWATAHQRPVFLGEFGAYDKADMPARARYTAALARAAERLGWSWAYWQFDSDFIVYDIPGGKWVEPIHLALIPEAAAANLGQFDGRGDVGRLGLPSGAEFLAAEQCYRLTGSGQNMWGKEDACQFVWRRVSGDASLAAEVEWVGAGKNPHRKACLMLRQSLAADAPYVDVAVHGDGLISLQYRQVKGGPTAEVQAPIKAPATVRLERRGGVFTLGFARPGEPMKSGGTANVALTDPVYAGLAVCSHDDAVSETAVFRQVALTNTAPAVRP